MGFGSVRRLVARSILGGGLACGGLGLASGVAHAQHVVTEAEASKLTCEALTAPPPRPIYRAYVHRVVATRSVWRGRHEDGVRAYGRRGIFITRISERRAMHVRATHHHLSRA